MHELSIAESILDIVAGAVESRGRVTAVSVTLGPLSGVSPDALRFCFTEVAAEKGFDSPALVIHEPPAQMRCRDCGHLYESKDIFEGCPQCESLNRELLSGHEFFVESVELEEEEDGENA